MPYSIVPKHNLVLNLSRNAIKSLSFFILRFFIFEKIEAIYQFSTANHLPLVLFLKDTVRFGKNDMTVRVFR